MEPAVILFQSSVDANFGALPFKLVTCTVTMHLSSWQSTSMFAHVCTGVEECDAT